MTHSLIRSVFFCDDDDECTTCMCILRSTNELMLSAYVIF